MENNVLVHLDSTDYTCRLEHGEHRWTLDEPVDKGGRNLGPDPYAALLGCLGSCSAITLKMYTNRKGWDIQKIDMSLQVSHRETPDKKITVFTSEINITGNITDEQLQRLHQIVKACPVSKILEAGVEIETIIKRVEL